MILTLVSVEFFSHILQVVFPSEPLVPACITGTQKLRPSKQIGGLMSLPGMSLNLLWSAALCHESLL